VFPSFPLDLLTSAPSRDADRVTPTDARLRPRMDTPPATLIREAEHTGHGAVNLEQTQHVPIVREAFERARIAAIEATLPLIDS
jgi:hypothetical protein